MDETPKTLEEALIQIDGWRAAYQAKLDEIVELNKEITRLEAALRSQLARKDKGLEAAIKRMCAKCEEDDPLCEGRHDCDLVCALREPYGRKGE